MKILNSALLLLVLSPMQTQGADINGHFAIWGKGSKSCHSYNIAKETEAEQMYKEYIMGYLTSFNTHDENTYRISGDMDINAITSWLDDYCTEKPVVAFEQSLYDFVVEHYDNRMEKSPAKFQR